MDQHETEIRDALREAFQPLERPALERDLWPQMLGRLDRASLRPSWLDCVLACVVPIWCVLFPRIIPGLLYHF